MNRFFYLGIIFLIISCGKSTKSAEDYGREYCDCMQKNNSAKDFYGATIICDSKLIQENIYFRITFIEALYGAKYITHYSEDTLEYAHRLKQGLFSYLLTNCPDVLSNKDTVTSVR